MIESRYKIEYVLPDDEIKKSSPFKVFGYLLLIPLVAVIVTAIAYDFSVKEMSRDSMVLLEKAKVHLLNLGDENQLKKFEEQKKAKEQLAKIKATLPVKTSAKPDVKTIESKS